MTSRFCFIALLSACLVTITAPADAEDDDYMRIARLSYTEGHISFQHASDVDWTAASVNLPLEPQDRIYTGPDGRAEIEFDDGSVYRLAENTDIEILTLREELIQLRVLVGVSTLNASSGLDFEINTPAAAFNARRKGVYRFNVGANGETEAIVRKGELEAASNEFSRRIESGEMLRVSPEIGDKGMLARYDKRDQWDEWNDRRNVDRNAYGSRNYLPASVYIGVAELDRYGRWVDAGLYGSAWAPLFVDDFWSPYSMGRWCYRPFFGWTWVSYEPWGWLPYHYGRWHRSSSFGWCWLPGAGFGFNFWSPGLVSFYNGPGWISWCPLGPGDYYNVNHYHYNRGHYGYQFGQLRALHTRRPGDLFNRDARGAFQTADIEHFRNGSFTDRNRRNPLGNIDQPWNQGSLVKDRLDVRPTAASFSAAPDRSVVRPGATNSLPAIVRTSPRADSGNRERFTKITNPQVPALQPRTWRNRESPGAAEAVGAQRPTNRVIKVTGAEHTYRSESAAPGSNTADRSVRTVNAPRASDSRQNSGENARNTWRSAPADRPAGTAPSVRQNSSVPRYERVTPQQNQTTQPPAVSAPSYQNRPQNNYSAPRSSSGGGWGASGAGTARTPEVRRSTIYSAPRQSFRSYSGQSYGGARSSGGGARSFSAPFVSRSGGSAGAPSAGRSGGGVSSGRTGGNSGGSPAGRSRR